MNTILFNNQPLILSQTDLPCLIHGTTGTGASLFTMTLVAQLFRQGRKILALCGYPLTLTEFIQQTQTTDYLSVTESTDRALFPRTGALFLTKENTEVFLELLATLPDIKERILLIKNIDLFSESIFDQVRHFPNLIVSGNVETCMYREKIITTPYEIKCIFSPLAGFSLIKGGEYEGSVFGHLTGGIKVAISPDTA